MTALAGIVGQDSVSARSVDLDDGVVTVHLQLPAAFSSSNFAYLLACEARDALRKVDDLAQLRVLIHGHHDSERINVWLATDAGHAGAEADDSLAALRQTCLRRAHAAAIERCVSVLVAQQGLNSERVRRLTLRDLPDGEAKNALLRRRFALGLSMCPNARVVTVDQGNIEEISPQAAEPRFIHTGTRDPQ